MFAMLVNLRVGSAVESRSPAFPPRAVTRSTTTVAQTRFALRAIAGIVDRATGGPSGFPKRIRHRQLLVRRVGLISAVVVAGRRFCRGRREFRGPRRRLVTAAAAAPGGNIAFQNSGDEAEPPPLLRRLQRSLTFYGAILPVLGQYTVRPWLHELGLEPKGGRELMEEMDEWGSTKLCDTLLTLGGFYVKTGQVLSTRVDLFSEPYTRKLRVLQDSLPAVPTEKIKAVVSEELCGGRALSELFREFDPEPLGTASIAQVHRAVLNDGREVAVKVLRPNCEGVLRGDIANLKVFGLALRGRLPVDYYPVFCELERALDGELDFLTESQNTQKVAAAISRGPLGQELQAPLTVPTPLPGLATRRCLVLEFIKGSPLSKLEDRAKELGLDLDGPMGKALGRQILEALSGAYGNMIFSSGFIHGDPHPGNIFVQEGGRVALIDCGQVAQLYREQRVQVAQAILAAEDYDGSREAIKNLADVVRSFGVTFFSDTKDEDAAAASVALYLFGAPDVEFPGGYSREEFSDRSPLRRLATFPSELVLLGRASVLVKGVAARLGVKWSVAEKWAPLARESLEALCSDTECSLPAWALSRAQGSSEAGRLRFRSAVGQCASLLRRWGTEKAAQIATSRHQKGTGADDHSN